MARGFGLICFCSSKIDTVFNRVYIKGEQLCYLFLFKVSCRDFLKDS